ncbi:sensor histidine kinase [Mucilaginibacter gilvus]|uniref:histidine kinase n=1 Tax=Mucilaginibacter gilvus TaxID=2305909 RepID=A0A444MQF0_9SPHI|nr:HAMP domain-containing sensor histidine kinase [Mucilaginibacter gilvus]RWY53864.1 HAMP domain-containing histidine kinase [Mucilaginibacter gilvus]
MLSSLVAGLNDPTNRFQAANKLAHFLGCSNLFVFIVDREIGILLPAPGFPQTLPNGKLWLDFTSGCSKNGHQQGLLPFPEANTLQNSKGFLGPEQSVIVFLGGIPTDEQIRPLIEILPILINLFTRELVEFSTQARIDFADKAVTKAEKLAATIDVMRLHLKDALVEQKKDKKAIEELMQKKDEFMNVASHELKTPITTTKAYLQILQKLIPPQENSTAGDFILKANKQLGKLTSLINDLLDVSKIHAGQMVYHYAEIDLKNLIEEVVAQVQVTTQTHQVIIAHHVSAKLNGEQHRLEQVINNFLSNAIKYSPGGEKVIIRSDITDHTVKLSVRDFGIGIPFEKQQYVFDRFYRVQESSKKFSGLGLGLYISAEIIKRHGGTIGVNSDASGSEFYFTLPLLTPK